MKTKCAYILAKKSRKWVSLLNFSEPDTKCNSWKLTFIERTRQGNSVFKWKRRKNDWHFGEMACDGSGGNGCDGGGCLNIPRIKVKWLNANGIKLCRLTLDHILWSFSSFGCVNPFRFGWLAGRSDTKCYSLSLVLFMQGKWSDLMCPIHEIHTKHCISKQASKQTSKPINNSMHCLILATFLFMLAANSECYLCEFCKHHELSLSLSVITRIFIGIILISFSTPINFCHAREQKPSKTAYTSIYSSVEMAMP